MGEPEDDAQPRPQFATWLAFEANNNDFHNNQPREFDEGGLNHTFGHSFLVPIGGIDLSKPVTLTAKFTQVGGNDVLGFQPYDGPESLFDRQNDPFPFPQSSFGIGAGSFLTVGSGGASNTSNPITFDLHSLTIGNANSPFVGLTVAESINSAGYLDVFVADDTVVDYLVLTYNVPEPTTLVLFAGGLAVLGAIPTRRDRG